LAVLNLLNSQPDWQQPLVHLYRQRVSFLGGKPELDEVKTTPKGKRV